MRAKSILESSNLNGPWNQAEDKIIVNFEMDKDGESHLISKVYVNEEDFEILENRSIDPMLLDKALFLKIGIAYDDLEPLEIEEELIINGYKQMNNKVIFETNIGDIIISMTELFNLADETQKMQAKWRKDKKG
jgi:hypothetical protein